MPPGRTTPRSGAVRTAPGAEGASLVFDGGRRRCRSPREDLSIRTGPFTFAAWVCPYGSEGESADDRGQERLRRGQAGVGVDERSGFQIRFYVRDGGWTTWPEDRRDARPLASTSR
jgi:hypothetical protein